MRSLRPFLILTLFLSAVVLPRGFLLAESKDAVKEEAQAIATKAADFLTRVGKGSAIGGQWTSASSGGGGGGFSLVGSKSGPPTPNWGSYGGSTSKNQSRASNLTRGFKGDYNPDAGKLISQGAWSAIPKGTGKTFIRPENITHAHEAYAVGIEYGVYHSGTKVNLLDAYPKVKRQAAVVTYADVPGSKSAMVAVVSEEEKTWQEKDYHWRQGPQGENRSYYTPGATKSLTSTRTFIVVNTLVDLEKSLMENVDKTEGKTDVETRSMMSLSNYAGVKEYRRTQDIDKALHVKGVLAGRHQIAMVYNSFADNALLNTWVQAMQDRFGDDADAMDEWLTKNISKAAANSPKEGMAESFAYYANNLQLPGFLDAWGRHMIIKSGMKPNPPVKEAP